MQENKLIIISFTDIGSQLNAALCRKLTFIADTVGGYAPQRLADKYQLNILPKDRKAWISEQWGKSNFLFIGAAGIAIRSVAHAIKDKYTDSAVLVMDERAEFVIPLLSGHIGGAVDIAKQIADVCGSRPVLTTASDVQGKFAVDVFAKKNHLKIQSRRKAKEIAAAILEGKPVGFYSQYPLTGEMPPELVMCRTAAELAAYDYGIAVTDEQNEMEHVLWLIPVNIIVGAGCRKGIEGQKLKTALAELLARHRIVTEQLETLVSIDLKKEEQGLLELAAHYQIPFQTFSSEELAKIKDVSVQSTFVKETTGVGNVCESAAKHYCPNGEMIQEKEAAGGMTFALVRRNIKLIF